MTATGLLMRMRNSVAAIVLGLCIGNAPAQAAEKPATSKSASLYDTSVVHTMTLTFADKDWESKMEALFNSNEEVPATATFNGVTYRDVGVSFRGSSSFRMVRTPGAKRPLKIKFDHVHNGQAVMGYRTLNLLNGMNDPTFLRTVLYSRIASAYLPAPKAGFVRLTINGENWGLYPHQQQFNKEFTNDFFRDSEGVRWKVPGSPRGRAGMEYWGDDLERYRAAYEIDNKDRPDSWQSLISLFRVLNETPADKLEAALKPIFDIDGALRFLAVEMALVNTDGYWTRASDYYIYKDSTGKFHVLPHDMNEAFGPSMGFGFGRGGPGGVPGGGTPGGAPNVPGGGPGAGTPGGLPGARPGGMNFGSATLDPLASIDDPGKPLRSKLLAIPELRRRYLGYVLDIAQKHLDWNTLGPAARQMHTLIAADVNGDTHKLYSNEQFVSGLEGEQGSIKTFVEQRRAYLLSTVPDLIKATQGGK